MRLVTSVDRHALVDLLKCGGPGPPSTREPSRLVTGGCSTLFSNWPDEAGHTSFSLCWYWMPTASRPKLIRATAMYILYCQRNGSR